MGQASAEGSIGTWLGDSGSTKLVVANASGGSYIVSGMPTGSFLVASGNSVVPAILPTYLLRFFGNQASTFPSPVPSILELAPDFYQGAVVYVDSGNQRWTWTDQLLIKSTGVSATNVSSTGTIQATNLSATNYINLPSSTIVWASANYATLAGSSTSALNAQQAPNGFNVTGTLLATTVSATNYRNIRPYVSSVDSATTTTVNMGGDYDLYLVNTTTTSVTLYLPDASAWTSKQITVSKIDDGGSYRSVTLSGTTLQTATQTVRLYDPTESVTVISNGTNWYSLDYDRAYGVVVVAKNNTGSTITKGTPVRVTGATGDNVLIGAVSAANDHVPEAPNGSLSKCIGVVEHDIPNGEFGHVLTKGTLYKFNTNAYNEGDVLYLASGGGFTNVKLPAPYDEVFLGIVTRKQSVNGSILIDIANPIHINDIVGFNLASSLVNGDLISYDSTTSTFTNVQSVNVSGQGKFGTVSATIVSAAEAVYIDGATGYIVNPAGNITLSSVGGVVATNGTMNVANGSGNIFLRAGRAGIYTDTAASAYYIATNNYADPRANYIVAQTSAGDSYLGAKSGQTLSIVVPSKTVSSIVTADKLVEIASTSVTVRTPLISTTSIEAVSVSATNYLNLPQSDASSLNGYPIDVGSVPLSDGDVLAWDTTNSYYTIVPSSTFAGAGGGAPTTAQYLTLATDATLTNERVLTVGAGLGSLNGGAGGNFTLSAVYTSAIWNANKLQGYDVSSVAPSNNQVLSYNTTVSAWVPATNTGGTGISQAAAMTIIGFGGF